MHFLTALMPDLGSQQKEAKAKRSSMHAITNPIQKNTDVTVSGEIADKL